MHCSAYRLLVVVAVNPVWTSAVSFPSIPDPSATRCSEMVRPPMMRKIRPRAAGLSSLSDFRATMTDWHIVANIFLPASAGQWLLDHIAGFGEDNSLTRRGFFLARSSGMFIRAGIGKALPDQQSDPDGDDGRTGDLQDHR